MKSRLVLCGVVALGAAACSTETPATLFATGGIHSAARPPDVEVHEKISELVVDDRTAFEKGAYIERIQKAIDDLGVPPEILEGQIDADEARALDDMDRKRDLLRRDLTDVEQAGGAEWSSLKARVDVDLERFTRAVRKASNRPAPSSPRGE
jgi:hypothetical protein